jgi:hypothetical protein
LPTLEPGLIVQVTIGQFRKIIYLYSKTLRGDSCAKTGLDSPATAAGGPREHSSTDMNLSEAAFK